MSICNKLPEVFLFNFFTFLATQASSSIISVNFHFLPSVAAEVNFSPKLAISFGVLDPGSSTVGITEKLIRFSELSKENPDEKRRGVVICN